MAIYGFSYENVFNYAKSPFSPISSEEADLLENYCLACGVRPYSWKYPFKIKHTVYSSNDEKRSFISDEELDGINDIKDRLCSPVFELKEMFESAENAEGFCNAIFEFLNRVMLYENVKKHTSILEKANENLCALQTVQVYNILIDIFDDILALFPDSSMTAPEFYKILMTAMDSVEIGTIPSSADCVNAGSIDRAKGHAARHLFLIGVNGGVFPAPINSQGLFSDDDKEALRNMGIELPPDTVRKSQGEMLLVYDALSCASDSLVLSYPLSDSDSSVLLPSEIINRVSDIFPDIPFTDDISANAFESSLPPAKKAAFDFVVTSLRENKFFGKPLSPEVEGAAAYFLKDDTYAPLMNRAVKLFGYGNFTSDIKPEILEKFIGKNMRTSISRLETYNRCPFSYFSKYLLGLEKKQTLELNVSDSGSFLHDFLERFSMFISESRDENGNALSWSSIDAVFIRKHTPEILSEILKGVNEAMLDIPRIKALFDKLCKSALQCALTVQRHIKNSDFVPLGYEISFDENGSFKPISVKLEDGRRITLRGRIDRADVIHLKMPDNSVGEFARIVDYKSSEHSVSLSDVYSGISLQLFVYLSNLCENGYRPAGILYCTLADPIVSISPSSTDEEISIARNNKMRMTGIVLENYDMKEHMGGSGVISSDKKLSEKQFNQMFEHLRRVIKNLGDDIYSGKFPICKTDNACRYCDYASICQFDASLAGCRVKEQEKFTDNEVLELLDSISENEGKE